MSKDLQEILLVAGTRSRVIEDCVVVLEREVDRKRGVSGMVIKTGFKVIKKLDRGRLLYNAVDMLLDDFTASMNPFYQDFVEHQDKHTSFPAFVARRENEVANALLSVTDRRRQRATNKVLIKTYDKLRGVAVANVKEGLPELSKLIEKYAL
jgi:hypothetical protein